MLDAILQSQYPALALALAIIGAFITGTIVSGRTADGLLGANKDLRATVDALRVAFDRRTDVDEERNRVEKQLADERRDRRGSG